MEPRDQIIKHFEMVLKFAHNIYFETNERKCLDVIAKLQLIQNRIKSKEDFTITNDELAKFVLPIRDMFVEIKPTLREQLRDFWDSIAYVNASINRKKVFTRITMFEFEKLKNMANLSYLHSETVKKYVENPDEKSHLYALCYCHVTRVDVFEESIKPSYEELLLKHSLDQKYDSNKIFSIEKTAKMKTKGKKKSITDIRAVRNCLAHYLYSINQENDWTITFKSGEKDDEFTIYSRTFSREEFVDFLNDSNILYQLMIMLMNILSAVTYLTHFAKEPLQLLPYKK